ncbi:phage baseplate assembly protein V [Ursidibacter sp. B-7004-1]
MTEPNRTELLRRLDNLLRLGTIAEVDYVKALVKVQSGNILTDWLPWVAFRAGTTQSWSPPTTGEQCLVLAVSGELTTAVVLVGLYTQNAPSQSPDEHCIKFADGMELKYNQASGHLTVKNCKTANIQATSSITADTPSFTCTGNVVIQGSLSVKGAISTQGSMTAQGEVSGKGINLSTHTHSGVESGNKRTGTPNG